MSSDEKRKLELIEELAYKNECLRAIADRLEPTRDVYGICYHIAKRGLDYRVDNDNGGLYE